MITTHRGFTITISPAGKHFEYKITKLDGTLIRHPDAEGVAILEDGILEAAKQVIDDYLMD